MNKAQYLLTQLAEECAEVAQLASKAIRFGTEEVQPDKADQLNNADRIMEEFHDLIAVMEFLHKEGILPAWSEERAQAHKQAKLLKIVRYMVYSKQQGILQIETKERCCGRCDGVNDLCVTDTTCSVHSVQGCELCYGPIINVE